MIDTKIEINGKLEEVQLFESLFEYVTEFGSDISHYNPIHRDDDKTFIVSDVDIIGDVDFVVRDSISLDGEDYIRVNWGESYISFIKESGLYQTLYTIWQEINEGEYHNYRSLFYESEEEAQKKADELNKEE